MALSCLAVLLFIQLELAIALRPVEESGEDVAPTAYQTVAAHHKHIEDAEDKQSLIWLPPVPLQLAQQALLQDLEVEAKPKHAARADAGLEQIAVNPGSFALLAKHLDTDDATRSKVVAMQRIHAMSPDEAHASGVKRSEGVSMKPKFIDFLFNLIDYNDLGRIEFGAWQKKVKGPWKPLMYPVLDKDGDSKITLEEFKSQWNPAVDKTFAKLGGEEDGKIDEGEIDLLWSSAFDYEISFAKEEFCVDGHIDGADFEEFLYTVMVFNCMITGADGRQVTGDASVTWSAIAGNPTALKAFGGQDTKDKFDAYFGEDGAQLHELFRLFNQNMVFVVDGAERDL